MIRRFSGLLALSLLATPLAAQTGSKVPGFDINWGATQAQVNAYWRETPRNVTQERGVSMLEYQPWEGMNWTVMVHDQQGLIGIVASSLPDLDPAMCDRVFEAWLRDLREGFPGITPTGGKAVPPGQSACTAVREGRGTAAFNFVNPQTDVLATIWVNAQNGLVNYAMGTRAFREWAGVQQQVESMGLSPAAAPPVTARNLGVTERAMRAIRPGHTIEDVRAIVGSPGELQASATAGASNTQTYTWAARSGLPTIVVTFQDGRAAISLGGGFTLDTNLPPVTAAQFAQLRDGMTYDQAQRVLGSPGISNGFTDVMGTISESYLWPGRAPGSFISVSFTRGQLTTRMNMGVN